MPLAILSLGAVADAGADQLIVDADEVVTPELAQEIARRIGSGEAEGYYLNSQYFFLGRRIRHCGRRSVEAMGRVAH